MAGNADRYYIQKLDGKKPQLESLKAYHEFWDNAKAGRYENKPKLIKEKTWKQCKAMFGVALPSIVEQCHDLGIGVSDLLKYLLDDKIPKGQGLTKEFLHGLMYAIFPTVNEDGEVFTLSNMSTVQAANLYNALQNIFAPLGVNVPNPDPLWFKNQNKETSNA